MFGRRETKSTRRALPSVSLVVCCIAVPGRSRGGAGRTRRVEVRIWAVASATWAPCPRCARAARECTAVTGAAWPMRRSAALPVTILLGPSILCDDPACGASTFVEQVPGLTSRYARRTPLLRHMLTSIGVALAGRAGARLATMLGIRASRSTLLRLVRAVPIRRSAPPPSSVWMTSRCAAATSTAAC